MSLKKSTQSLLSVLSVVTLTVFGTGLYVAQQGSLASQADSTTAPQTQPSVSITVSSPQVKTGEVGSITITGNNFSTVPVTGGTLVISFPAHLISVSAVSSDGGVLDAPYTQNIDNDLGVVTLTFLPPAGVTVDGAITRLDFVAKKQGSGTITFITGQPEPYDTTGFTTLTSVRVPPLFLDAPITLL